MGDKGHGVSGTLRRKRTIGFPLPNKKQTNKDMKRWNLKVIFNQDSTVAVWKDNQLAIYMASNCCCCSVVLTGQCQRYSKEDMAYNVVPQPSLKPAVQHLHGRYGPSGQQNEEICHLHKSVQVVLVPVYLVPKCGHGAGLVPAHKKDYHRIVQVQEQEAQEELERQMQLNHAFKHTRNNERREREQKKKMSRTPERADGEYLLPQLHHAGGGDNHPEALGNLQGLSERALCEQAGLGAGQTAAWQPSHQADPAARGLPEV
jgi:hypothetical protein